MARSGGRKGKTGDPGKEPMPKAGSASNMPQSDPGTDMPGEERTDVMPEAQAGADRMPGAGGESGMMKAEPGRDMGMPEAGDGARMPGPGGQQEGSPEPGEGGLVQVLVEIRVPSEEGPEGAMQAAAGLTVPGFQLDTGYEPVPIEAAPGGATELASANERAVVVRGAVERDRMGELEAQPNVIRVYLDTPIAPFQSPQLLLEEGTFITPGQALGDCAISPCDCEYWVAKGTIGDVATYLGANQVWSAGVKGGGTVVGVVDGGITAIGRTPRPGETAKISRVIDGFPADWGTTAAAWGDHGNMCATDVLGMAPDAQLHDIRISAGTIQATISAALSGYDWAINKHKADGTPHILSNSWGIFQDTWDLVYATDPTHPFTRKVVEALNEGILILFAAGNCGEACPDGRCGSDFGPGNSIWGANGHSRVMTVAAVNKNEQYIGYSSQGPAALDPRKPDFCSVSHFKGYFASDSGTSAATPIAAGVVALMKGAVPSLTQDQAKAALMGTAKDIGPAGWDTNAGAGIIRAKAAFDQITRQGRLEVFARGMDHGLWHRWQVAPSDGWNPGWASQGGWIDQPVVGRNADGRLEVFVIGTDHALWHRWQVTPGGAWSGWATLGGQIDRLAVGRNADGRLEVFARGMDGAVWHRWQVAPSDGWSPGWSSLGGVIDLLAVGNNADGRLEVFARGMDGAVWHRWQVAPSDGWSPGWSSLGGVIDQLAVGKNHDGRLEVFARGMDQALWHRWQTAPNDGWSPGWSSLGGWIDQPTASHLIGLATDGNLVARNADGRLEVFVIGTDHGVWHKWQVSPGGGWSGWASLGGWVDQLVLGQNAA